MTGGTQVVNVFIIILKTASRLLSKAVNIKSCKIIIVSVCVIEKHGLLRQQKT